MQKVTLTAVYHNDKDRNGVAYVSKQGKPYTKCNIKATEYGDKYISGFGNKTTQAWKVGDTVEIEITPNGEYLNFSVPKVDAVNNEALHFIKEALMRIEKKTDSINWHIVEMAKAQKSGAPMYPSPEMEGIDVSRSGDVPELKDNDVPF